jgi:hypothetical protein
LWCAGTQAFYSPRHSRQSGLPPHTKSARITNEIEDALPFAANSFVDDVAVRIETVLSREDLGYTITVDVEVINEIDRRIKLFGR